MKALHNLAINERRRTAGGKRSTGHRLTRRPERQPAAGGDAAPAALSPGPGGPPVAVRAGLDYDEIANLLGISEVGGRSPGIPGCPGGSGRSGTEARRSLSQNKREISNFCTFPLWGQKKPSSGNAA